jgi:transposase-like protein
LTKRVLELALEGEMTGHVGYEPYDPAGHHSGNSRNGTRTKTVITDIGPVELDVPRDRNGTFEPVIVRNASGAWAVSTRWSCRCPRRG